MSDPADELDDEEDRDLGPTLAIPPLYLLRTAVRCWRCHEGEHVYSIGCASFRDAESGHPIEQFHFLHAIRSLPDAVLEILKTKCPLYFFDQEEETDPPYLMNHCRCDGRLDDDFLHGDIGAAFWPDTPEGFGRLTLFTMPIHEAIPVVCAHMVGGGEYLDMANAKPWTALATASTTDE